LFVWVGCAQHATEFHSEVERTTGSLLRRRFRFMPAVNI
jgi:hypothetical protein